MTNGRPRGPRFPYLPIRFDIQQQIVTADALLDTGFDGDVVVPGGTVTRGRMPDGYSRWTLADGSTVLAPYHVGTVEMDGHGPFPAVIVVLGTEVLIGAGAVRHVTIVLDHGQRVIIQP
jgi:predicted aspartyl protease